MLLPMCKTASILDYRPVVFLDGEGYVRVTADNGRSIVAKVVKGPCKGVSREVAYLLYPYYGWGRMEVAAEFQIEPVDPVRATRVVMRVPFGISEVVVRRQLEGYPIYEGSVALEYLEHIEFGEVVHVEPSQFSVLTPETKLRLVEVPVEDSEIIFLRR
ncbi:hypothetical protein [Pyrobaculum aerophilum]|uniref:Uncharacterized protein n=1 Tax=Pyrobaculum aerophilum TaxID=13773 RepID=A0A371QV42_9CREN|nr:hypothetical protein [Pyrobaculum aerophilum]RFA93808.1 hypothetical protein CGL51_12260 [Pyrobaculum aerophilum]RFA98642.1 hypothetical protein CGL52_06360 [Pyrobaculum aerophilum]